MVTRQNGAVTTEEQQAPANWDDAERIRRWIAGAREREAQMRPVNDALFAAAALRPGERVLDVGCGTGPTTVVAAAAVGPAGHVVGTDVAAAMITAARETVGVGGGGDAASVEWLVADAQTYDFGAETYDVLVSRFGVMFFPDPVAAFANLAAATRAGGRLAAAVWRTRDQVPLFDIPYRTAVGVLDRLGLPYTPIGIDDNQCSLGTPARVEGVLRPAGWHDIEIRPSEGNLYVGGPLSPEEAAQSALDLGPIRGLMEGQPAEVRDQVRTALELEYRPRYDGTGVVVPAGFMIITARRWSHPAGQTERSRSTTR